MKRLVRCYDLRESPRSITRRIGKGWRRGRIVKRDPESVDAICVHQTGVEFGAGPLRIRRAGGNKQMAIAHRSLDLPYHAMSFDGFYSLACPLDWYTYHGNSLNRRCIGVGIDGLYPGFEYQRRPKHTKLTDARIDAARNMLSDVIHEAEMHGMHIKYVFGHMQSNRRKPADPGQIIWREVVEQYLAKECGLQPVYNINAGGRAIPPSWR